MSGTYRYLASPVLLVFAAFVACSDTSGPVDATQNLASSHPLGVAPLAFLPLEETSTIRGFFFLPLLAPDVAFEGRELASDQLANLQVQVCSVSAGACRPVAVFTSSGGRSEALRIAADGGEPHLTVNWHTKEGSPRTLCRRTTSAG